MTVNSHDSRKVLDMAAAFMPGCVLGAAVELDLFTLIGQQRMSAEQVTEKLGADPRATRILLDALAALDLLTRQNDSYSVPAELRSMLIEESPKNILPGIRHRINVMRGWSQLAWVVKAGIPAPRQASIRGAEADRAAFLAAMNTYSDPVADDLVGRLGSLKFKRLLDIGGASGTWTLAFLRAVPGSRATLFDLPDAVQQARDRLAGTEFSGRVDLVAGDFYSDDLPAGADFVWLSAIAHQHGRQQNRELLAKAHAALTPGGQIAIRDVVMEPCRGRPVFGAMFAINMLVNTDSGDTFTFDEFAEDLQAAGFTGVELRVKSEDMNSVIVATKPE